MFFWGKELTFHNAGSDFYFAAGMRTKFSGDPGPLEWARRLSDGAGEVFGCNRSSLNQSTRDWDVDFVSRLAPNPPLHEKAGFDGVWD